MNELHTPYWVACADCDPLGDVKLPGVREYDAWIREHRERTGHRNQMTALSREAMDQQQAPFRRLAGPSQPVGFESPYPTAISQISRTGWRLIDHLVWNGIDRDGKPERFEIQQGEDTDFASSPASLWSEFPPYGDYTAAVIAHDDFWRRRVPAGLMTYRDADRHLRIMLAAAGVSWLRRWTMWAAVRWGSLLTRRGGHRGWWRDSAQVLGMTAVALPFVVVPYAVNTVFRSLFAALEWLISAVFPSSKGAPAPSTPEENHHGSTP